MTPERWAQVKEIFHSAVERDESEREEYLAGACGSDALLLREVGSLLREQSTSNALISPVRGVDLSGRTVTHFRVLEKLGEGGMGMVYKAEDLKLGRTVALKFLAPHMSVSEEHRARFMREARALAAIDHPHICAVHEIDEAEGRLFLAMAFVDGPTLKEKIADGPLEVDEALRITIDAAQGLQAAHRTGVIHRDVKSANIMLDAEGRVIVTDFGLARLEDQPGLSRSGLLMGTPAYMSPEQLRGEKGDRRSDTWSLGVVLYEAVSGKLPFPADRNPASILSEEPGLLAALRPEVPPGLDRVVRKALAKSPDERYQTAEEMAADLRELRGQAPEETGRDRVPRSFTSEITETSGRPSIPEAVSLQRPGRGWIAAALLGGTLLAVAAALITWHLRPLPFLPVVRFTVKAEPGLHLNGMRFRTMQPTRTAMAISSDGNFIVYSATPENPGPQAKPLIYLRRTDRMDATPVAGTEGGISPFLSPNDRWLGFWASGKWMKVPVHGGVPDVLCDAGGALGADWGPDNRIVYTPEEIGGLNMISSEGGSPEILTVRAKDEYSHRLPHYLPDGRGVLFTIMADGHDLKPRLALLDFGTRKWRVVMENAADGRYLRTGHLVFLRQGTLMVMAFDLGRLEAKGQPVPVIPNVMQALNIFTSYHNSAAGQYSASSSGWLVYVPGGIQPDAQDFLVRVDRKGNAQPVADFAAPFHSPRFSPEGRRIAYRTIGAWQVWVYSLSRGTASRLTGEGRASFPVWTPDGKRLVFSWGKSNHRNLYWQVADGSSPMERLATSENLQLPGSFSPDGATLAFTEFNPETLDDILLFDVKSRRATPFLNSKARESFPEISPDGRWLAYASDESGRTEVWVQPFPGPGGRWQISKNGGNQPIWSKDGRELFYRQPRFEWLFPNQSAWPKDAFQSPDLRVNQVWVADVQTAGGFSAGKPRLLFEYQGLVEGAPIRNWDLWPNGREFLMVKTGDPKDQPVTEMILVQNWFEELKHLVPAGK